MHYPQGSLQSTECDKDAARPANPSTGTTNIFAPHRVTHRPRKCSTSFTLELSWQLRFEIKVFLIPLSLLFYFEIPTNKKKMHSSPCLSKFSSFYELREKYRHQSLENLESLIGLDAKAPPSIYYSSSRRLSFAYLFRNSVFVAAVPHKGAAESFESRRYT